MSDRTIANLTNLLELHSLKLNSLLSISTAINQQESTGGLLKAYSFALKEQLGFRKHLLISDFNGWKIFIKSGTKVKTNLEENLEHLMRCKELTFISESNSALLNQFDVIIPVIHGDKPLAFLLITTEKQVASGTDLLEFAQILTNLICVAIENKRLAETIQAKELIHRDLATASELQMLLFPSNLPSNRKMDVSAKYVARDVIGGDYYDFIPLGDEEYIICIADVSGKGISAALLMANFQATLRTLFRYQRFDLSFLIEELNKKVLANAKGEKFITFFIGHYNAFTRKLKYINAGHNQPLLLIDKNVHLLSEGCTGLGIIDELPSIKVGKIEVPVKSTLVLYTDGVVELENNQGEQFSLEQLIKIIQSFSTLKMEDMNSILFSKLDEWKGELPYGDDTAILSCKFF
ncbi:MAG: SpoIIE family protein phosphatase [Bacteroidetes bacterium]|nr:SpoIIE family protein phosphatase [Bacteroidota bacterium]MBM3424031.1 serine/threonine protein phosphatase [Bacteroidota bacterium]